MPPDIVSVLEDILGAANSISDDTAGITPDVFLCDRRARQLVERNVLAIREAANRLRRHGPDFESPDRSRRDCLVPQYGSA